MARNAMYNVIYKLVSILFPLITVSYVSRILMPEGIGIVSAAQNTAAYFVSFASLGLPVYGVRELAKVSSEYQNKVFTELMILNAVFAIVSFFFYVSLIIFGETYRDDLVLYLMCGFPVFLNFLNIDWLYQAKEEYSFIAIRSIMVKLISLFLIFLFVKAEDDYIVYSFIVSIGTMGNYLFNIVNAKKYVKLEFKEIDIWRHLKPISALGVVVIVSSVYSKLDVTMLGKLASNETVGLYANAHRGIEVLLTLCAAITSTFLPKFSIYAQENKDKMIELVEKGYKVITFIVIPAAVGLWMLSPQIVILLFGDAFAMASSAMRIFTALLLIRVYGDLFSYQLLIAIGKERTRVPVAVVAMAINIILNYILIPQYTYNGAAVATVISELIMNGVLFIYIIHYLNLKINWIQPLKEAIIGTIIMAIVVLGVLYLFEYSIWGSVVSIIIGIIVYIIVNYMQCNFVVNMILNRLAKK